MIPIATREFWRRVESLTRKVWRGGPGIVVDDRQDSTSIALDFGQIYGAGGMPGLVTPVKVWKDGGTAGSLTEQCTFTYGIWPYLTDTADMSDDNRLAAALLPIRGRASLGTYAEAVKGSYGLAIRQSAGWLLLDALAETPLAEACPE